MTRSDTTSADTVRHASWPSRCSTNVTLVAVRRTLPGLLAYIVAVVVVLNYGVSICDVVRYTFTVLWSVLLPGGVVLRWCRPPGCTFFEDLCVAFVVGLVTQLIAWAIFVGVGVGSWLIVYPAVLVAGGLLVPRLRERLCAVAYQHRTPAYAAWAMTAAYTFAIITLGLRFFAAAPLPPGRARWYQDLYWHLAISAEARHSAPPQVPQVSGQELKYHWFSNAHMAADSLVGHLGILAVTVRLWYLPIYAGIIGLTYMVATRLSRSPKAGVLAVVLLISAASLNPLAWYRGSVNNSLGPLSPSEIFGLPMMLLAVWWLAGLVRGERNRWPSWVLLSVLLVTCAGAKSSNLPVLLCGLLLVLSVAAVRRGLTRGAVVAAGLTLLALLATAPFLAGGSDASTIRLLSLPAAVRARNGYPTLTSLPHLQIVSVLLLFAAILLIQYAGVLLALPLLGDPAAVLLLGVCVAGAAAMLLISHPSLSQVYFMLGVLPVLDVLIAWGAVRAMSRAKLSVRNPRHMLAVVLAAGTGAVVVYTLRWASGGRTLRTLTNGVLERGFLIAAIVLAALLTATIFLLGRGRQERAAQGIVTAALLGAILTPSISATAQAAVPTTTEVSANSLTPAQIAGTTWLRRNIPPEAVVATNVHCGHLPNRKHCDARAFWVTGLGEHQAYVESWGYTDQAQATAAVKLPPGQKRLYYAKQPFYDPTRLRLNDTAFSAPTPAGLAKLYRAGVRVLFADADAGPVSPRLDSLTDRVFGQGLVTVYRLRAPA